MHSPTLDFRFKTSWELHIESGRVSGFEMETFPGRRSTNVIDHRQLTTLTGSATLDTRRRQVVLGDAGSRGPAGNP